MNRRLVLLSGGIDSTTALGIAYHQSKEEDPDGRVDISALTFDYGQLHKKEATQAGLIAEFFGAHWYHEAIPTLGGILGSGDPDNVPVGRYEDFPGLSPTYVPYRNGTLLSFAAAIAMRDGWDEVWFGAHASDWGAWAYPDCSPGFMANQGEAIRIGTENRVELITPIINLVKSEVVAKAISMKAPIHLTWSCYRGGELQCGKCPTCNERKDAFAINGVEDPVGYEV